MTASTLVPFLSLTANVVLVAYLGFLMFVIGYGLQTENSFAIGRIDPAEGRQFLRDIANIDTDSESDVGPRMAMAILINLRINMAAWFAMLFTAVYGLCLPWHKRGTIHLLGFLANAGTGVVHLWHIGALEAILGIASDDLIPRDDPYHKLPLPSDWTVAIVNLAAFLAVAMSINGASTKDKDKVE